LATLVVAEAVTVTDGGDNQRGQRSPAGIDAR